MTLSRQSVITAARAFLPKDARIFQILFLALLLTTGVLLRDFSLHPLQMALVASAIANGGVEMAPRLVTQARANAASSIRPASVKRARITSAASAGTPPRCIAWASCALVLGAAVSSRRQICLARASGS